MAAKITFKNTDNKHLTIFNTDYSVDNIVVPEGKKNFWEWVFKLKSSLCYFDAEDILPGNRFLILGKLN